MIPNVEFVTFSKNRWIIFCQPHECTNIEYTLSSLHLFSEDFQVMINIKVTKYIPETHQESYEQQVLYTFIKFNGLLEESRYVITLDSFSYLRRENNSLTKIVLSLLGLEYLRYNADSLINWTQTKFHDNLSLSFKIKIHKLFAWLREGRIWLNVLIWDIWFHQLHDTPWISIRMSHIPVMTQVFDWYIQIVVGELNKPYLELGVKVGNF